MVYLLLFRQFLNPHQISFRQEEGLRFSLWTYFVFTVIVLFASKSEGEYSQSIHAPADCLNIKVPKWIQPYSFLEPCAKLWKGVNCTGGYISQQTMAMARSVSDCSACKRRNRSSALFCSGPKGERKCDKVASICDIGVEKFDTLKYDKDFDRRNVPVTIEPLDIRNFEVFSPLTRKEEEGPPVPFILYRKSNTKQGLHAETVEFKQNEKVVIYIHGYATTRLDDGSNIKDALFEGAWDVDSVIIVDWRKWSLPSEDSSPKYPPNYKIVALVNVPIVSEHVCKFLLSHLNNDNYIYILGFSLGGQIAGTAAREAAKSELIVDRISALDPAGPIFEYTLKGVYPLDTTNTLRISDASFVDVIHCSTVLGMENPAGHLDTYLEENDCKLPKCAHRRAIQLYISSLKRCSLITCPKSGDECSPYTVSAYGYLSDIYPGRGVYTLAVKTHWYSWKDQECSEFMNIYLPAKYRVCFEPLNTHGGCYGQPYLTECAKFCPNQTVMTSSVCSTHLKFRLVYKEARQNHDRSLKVGERKPDQVNWHGGDCM